MSTKEINPQTSVRTVDGVTLTLAGWADKLKLSPVAIHNRIAAGWEVRDAYTLAAREGVQVKDDFIARPSRFRVMYKGKVVSTHYRRGHAEKAIKADSRKGLKLDELEKEATSVGAGFRLSPEDKVEIMKHASEANMSFSLFIVTASLAAGRANRSKAARK